MKYILRPHSIARSGSCPARLLLYEISLQKDSCTSHWVHIVLSCADINLYNTMTRSLQIIEEATINPTLCVYRYETEAELLRIVLLIYKVEMQCLMLEKISSTKTHTYSHLIGGTTSKKTLYLKNVICSTLRNQSMNSLFQKADPFNFCGHPEGNGSIYL